MQTKVPCKVSLCKLLLALAQPWGDPEVVKSVYALNSISQEGIMSLFWFVLKSQMCFVRFYIVQYIPQKTPSPHVSDLKRPSDK